jgi:5-hydroxyisourate hydrolase-like protein (transthyretin family)
MRAPGPHLIPILFLLCCAAESWAQIRGEVVDQTGAQIPGTTIRVLDPKSRKTIKTARTDTRGRFDLAELNPGQYTIVFWAKEFVPEMVEVDTAKAGSEIFRTVKLKAMNCDAPRMNCDTFSQVPISDPHPIVAEGTLTVSNSDAVDLDKRAIVPSTSISASFRLAEDGGALYLIPLNRAKLFNICAALQGSGQKRREILSLRVDGIGQNSEICMKSTHGRSSKLFLTGDVQPGDEQIAIYVVTREK